MLLKFVSFVIQLFLGLRVKFKGRKNETKWTNEESNNKNDDEEENN